MFKNVYLKKTTCLMLMASILTVSTLSGCAGREANLVQIHQPSDKQKSCKELEDEMFFVENEIARLLPKSDKTGSNIALGATGILFIVPLFFMDLKQGEKKEIEAFKQRYNHLFMIYGQKNCNATTPETTNIKPVTEVKIKLTACENCGESIGKLEKNYSHNGHTVCKKCSEKLK